MKRSFRYAVENKKFRDFSLVLIFILLLFFLYIYFLFDRTNTVVSWIFLSFPALLLLIQIIYFEGKKNLNLIFFEICLLFLSFQLSKLMLSNFIGTFTGLDTYFELNAVNLISRTGHWDTLHHAPSTVFPYPILHILTSSINKITNIRVNSLIIWLPLFFSFLLFGFFYLIGSKFFKNQKVALLSTLCLIYIGGIHTGNYGRMYISLLFFFLIVYLIIKSQYLKHFSKYLILFILCFIAITFVHPLARLIIIMFLIISFIYYKIIYKGNRNILKKIGIKIDEFKIIKPPSFFLVVVASTILLSYIIYFTKEYAPSMQFLNILIYGTNSNSYVPGLALSVPIKTKIFNYGQLLILIIFFMIIFFKREKIKNVNIFNLALFSFSIFLLNFFVYFFDLVNLFRLFLFLWPLLLLAVCYVVLITNHRKLIVCLFFSFIIVSMLGYGEFSFNRNSSPDYSRGEYNYFLPIENKLASVNFEYNGSIVGNHYFAMAFIGYEDREISENLDFYMNNFRNNSKYSWFFFDKTDMEYIFLRGKNPTYEKISDNLYLSYQSYNKMYTNGYSEVYNLK